MYSSIKKLFISEPLLEVSPTSYYQPFHPIRNFLHRFGFLLLLAMAIVYFGHDLFTSYQEKSRQKVYNDSIATEIKLIELKIVQMEKLITDVQENNPEVIKNLGVSKYQLIREKERLIQLIPESLQK